MRQLALDEAPPSNGTLTSDEAAESVEPLTGAMRCRILGAIRDSVDGLTTDEVEVLLGMSHQTASARVHELFHRYGVVYPASRRRTRSGRWAVVYQVTA